MRSKIITTVVVTLLIAPFAFTGYKDAVSIKRNLHSQQEQIEQLSTESVQLDQELDKTKEAKEQSLTEVQQLEQEAQDAILERQRLEAELGAN